MAKTKADLEAEVMELRAQVAASDSTELVGGETDLFSLFVAYLGKDSTNPPKALRRARRALRVFDEGQEEDDE